MKANYCVLWVDDNPEFMESLQDRLESLLEEKGFGLELISFESSSGDISSTLKNKEVELIVVDYNLGDEKGDKVIRDIRANKNFQDIVFYSQVGIPSTVNRNGLDGVFFATRAEAWDKIKSLVELRLRRSSDLHTFRGWIVADAIELEHLVTEIIGDCFLKKSGITFSERLLGHDGPLEFGAKFKLLNGILKDYVGTEAGQKFLSSITECKKTFDKFPEEVIQIRNAMAHQKEEVSESGETGIRSKTKDGKLIPFNLDECKKIQANLRRHWMNLQEIKKILA